MSDAGKKALAAGLTAIASRTWDSADQLDLLGRALSLDPQNEDIRNDIDRVTARKNGPAYVAIEDAQILGASSNKYRGQIFVELPDGCLRPIRGQDLHNLHDRFPGFIQNWEERFK